MTTSKKFSLLGGIIIGLIGLVILIVSFQRNDSERRSPAHWYEDAKAARNRHDFATAIRIVRPLADHGNARAEQFLGYMYTNGWGVPQDDAEAVKWYRRAADQGDAGAQISIGVMYTDGRGVPKDHIRAYFWLDLAAQSNEPAEPGYMTPAQAASMARDFVASKMTPAQITEAQRLARNWTPGADNLLVQPDPAPTSNSSASTGDLTDDPTGNLTNHPKEGVCLNALNREQTAWDQTPNFSKYVAEAKRRGFTPKFCRQMIAKLGVIMPTSPIEYQPESISVETFLHDARDLASKGASVSLIGTYRRVGNLDVLYADKYAAGIRLPPTGTPRVPLVTEDASRAFREHLLTCEISPAGSGGTVVFGCDVTVVGRATTCPLSNAFGARWQEPCVAVKYGFWPPYNGAEPAATSTPLRRGGHRKP